MIKSVLLKVISYDFSTSSVKEENKKKKRERRKSERRLMVKRWLAAGVLHCFNLVFCGGMMRVRVFV